MVVAVLYDTMNVIVSLNMEVYVANDIETLVMQAKQLSRVERVELIARLRADLAQDVPEASTTPQLLDELLVNAKPWKGLAQPLETQPDAEVSDFLEMRKIQREQDKRLEEDNENRLHTIWDS